MAPLTIEDAPTLPEHHRSRARLSLVASLVAFGVAIAAAASTIHPDRRLLDVNASAGSATAQAAAAPAGPEQAIESWLADHRDQLFAGVPAAYVGSCGDTDAAGLCSRLTDALGDVQVHAVGVNASDWGADVLVERDPRTGVWQVTGVAAWPILGDPYDGAPWSPATAIAAWWRHDARAETMYGAGAEHLATCDGGAASAASGARPLLCSTLVDDTGATRTYDSGLAGRPADVRLTLERQPDRTWAVIDALAR